MRECTASGSYTSLIFIDRTFPVSISIFIVLNLVFGSFEPRINWLAGTASNGTSKLTVINQYFSSYESSVSSNSS